MTETRQILQFASAITLPTVISRILGYIRHQRITLLLGTSFAADPFILAFRIPNLLRRMVGEGAMTAAFIPIFAGFVFGESWRESASSQSGPTGLWGVLLAPVAVLGVILRIVPQSDFAVVRELALESYWKRR